MEAVIREKTGLVPPDIAISTTGAEFLTRLKEGDYPAPPFCETTGIWPTLVEQGYVVFEGIPSQRFYNPMGMVHGGWIACLLDTAMGSAVHSNLTLGQAYSTIEFRTALIKKTLESSGTLRCEGRLLHAGKSIAHAEGKIFDDTGALVAYGSESCLIMNMQPAQH